MTKLSTSFFTHCLNKERPDLPYKLVHIPALLWNLPWDLVGAHRVVVGLLAEAEVVAQIDKRH